MVDNPTDAASDPSVAPRVVIANELERVLNGLLEFAFPARQANAVELADLTEAGSPQHDPVPPRKLLALYSHTELSMYIELTQCYWILRQKRCIDSRFHEPPQNGEGQARGQGAAGREEELREGLGAFA